MRLSDEQFAEMVRRLPNGCVLSHFSNGPEMDDVAWRVLDAQGNVLSEGASPEEALMRLGEQEQAHDWDNPEQSRKRLYRSGFVDGWLSCAIEVGNRGFSWLHESLFAHWEGPLQDWRNGDCLNDEPPPEMCTRER